MFHAYFVFVQSLLLLVSQEGFPVPPVKQNFAGSHFIGALLK